MFKKIKYSETKVDYNTAMNIINGIHPVYKSLYSHTLIEFECEQCGVVSTKRNFNFKHVQYTPLCSRCLSKITCLKKYGVDNPMKNKDVQQKSKETCMEKYGAPSPLESSEIANKIKETNIERYGDINPMKNKDIQDKVKTTCMEKYGCEYALQNEDIRKKIVDTNIQRYGCEWGLASDAIKQKSKETCIEKYGCEHSLQNDEIKQKVKNTCLEKYGFPYAFSSDDAVQKYKETCLEKFGVDHPSKCDEIKKKKVITCIEKYGVTHYSHTLESHKHRKSLLVFNSEHFDSKPELEFYKFCLDHNIDIKHHPIRLEYYYNDKKHYYFPDFEVNGILIEIKGIHFLNEDNNKWKDPFDSTRNGLYEAKYDCAVRNGVKIIYVDNKIKTEDILNTLCLDK